MNNFEFTIKQFQGNINLLVVCIEYQFITISRFFLLQTIRKRFALESRTIQFNRKSIPTLIEEILTTLN